MRTHCRACARSSASTTDQRRRRRRRQRLRVALPCKLGMEFENTETQSRSTSSSSSSASPFVAVTASIGALWHLYIYYCALHTYRTAAVALAHRKHIASTPRPPSPSHTCSSTRPTRRVCEAHKRAARVRNVYRISIIMPEAAAREERIAGS